MNTPPRCCAANELEKPARTVLCVHSVPPPHSYHVSSRARRLHVARPLVSIEKRSSSQFRGVVWSVRRVFSRCWLHGHHNHWWRVLDVRIEPGTRHFPYNENPTRALNTTSLKCCLPSTDGITSRKKFMHAYKVTLKSTRFSQKIK